MYTNRLFNLLVVIVLVVIVVLTVREAAATTSIISKTDSANQSQTECSSLPSRHSIHAEYVEEIGTWLPYTEDGPAGLDGGLIHLLSNYGACKQERGKHHE